MSYTCLEHGWRCDEAPCPSCRQDNDARISALEQELSSTREAYVKDLCGRDKTIGELRAEVEDLKSAEDGMDAWVKAAQRVGEELATVGPEGYYDMDADAWREWALKAVAAMNMDRDILRMRVKNLEFGLEDAKKKQDFLHDERMAFFGRAKELEAERDALRERVKGLEAKLRVPDAPHGEKTVSLDLCPDCGRKFREKMGKGSSQVMPWEISCDKAPEAGEGTSV